MATRAMTPGMLLNDRYRLDDLLSESGTARFWRGTDLVLGRSVAINAVPSSNSLAPRLLTAARDSARVHDPHLLRVLDCDGSGDITWVVNEWGSGTSLDILLQRGPLDPTRAAWLALETAETIEAAHAAGVCHGRLSPETVLVTDAGAVKIIGFAVSASIEGSGAEPSSRNPGTTYGHLEPTEADVIDVAGILYAALTGTWPGVAASAVRPAPTDHRGPLRPRQVRHGVPRMLDALCGRVLRDAAHEHSVPVGTAVEIVAALNDFLGSPLTAAPLDVRHLHDEPEDEHSGYDPDATAFSPVISASWDRPFTDETQAGGVPEPLEPVSLEPEPDLPPFEDSAERPLFASTPRRPALAAEPLPSGTDDAPEEPEPAQHRAPARRGRIVLLGLLFVALVTAMVLAYRAGLDPDAAPPTKSPATAPLVARHAADTTGVRIVSARDFDPYGSPPEENPKSAPLSIDGDKATGWRTSTYTRAKLGGLKSGVGLVLDLGAQTPVRSIQLDLGKAGPTSVELRATPTGANKAPRSFDDLTPAVESAEINGSGSIILTEPLTTRRVVLWITELPQVGAGKFRAEVREISVRR